MPHPLKPPRSPLEGAGGSLTGRERQTLDLSSGKARTIGTLPWETVGEPCCSTPQGARTRGAAGGCQQHPLHEVILSISTVLPQGLFRLEQRAALALEQRAALALPAAAQLLGQTQQQLRKGEEQGREQNRGRCCPSAAQASGETALRKQLRRGQQLPGQVQGCQRPGAAPTPPRPPDSWGMGNLPRTCRTPASVVSSLSVCYRPLLRPGARRARSAPAISVLPATTT